jgi:hypothetical protein
VVAVPVFSRRRHKVRHTIKELKRRQLDHAIGSRTRGLPPASRADPVGRLVSGQHVADTGDAAVLITPDGGPLQREGEPRALSQGVRNGMTCRSRCRPTCPPR